MSVMLQTAPDPVTAALVIVLVFVACVNMGVKLAVPTPDFAQQIAHGLSKFV